MKTKLSFFINGYHLPVLLISTLVLAGISCKKNDSSPGNGLETTLTPSFSVTAVAGKPNYFAVSNTTKGAVAVRWDFDQGAGFIMGKATDTVFFPDAGTYTISMQAMGKGGVFYDADPQTVNVATSDPVAGNIITGGKFDLGDDQHWHFTTITSGVGFEMKDGKMVASGGSNGNATMYQSIEVEANKQYRFSMIVSGSGATDTWFEVYFGKSQPQPGADYSEGGTQIALNTWAGCGNSSFNGDISKIGCSGALDGKEGVITFSESGTIYLVIKAGGSNLGTTGISMDNVELRGI